MSHLCEGSGEAVIPLGGGGLFLTTDRTTESSLMSHLCEGSGEAVILLGGGGLFLTTDRTTESRGLLTPSPYFYPKYHTWVKKSLIICIFFTF